MLIRSFLLISVLLVTHLAAQRDTLRFMQYNLLMFPEANPDKAFNMRPITRYIEPDIITVNEITSIDAIGLLLSEGLDSSVFAAATWIPDGELMSSLFYNKQKLGLMNARFLPTSPRRTYIYKLWYTDQDFSIYPDTLTFEVYVVHLKSSQGNENEVLRAAQTAAIRADMNTKPEIVNNFIAGDFNVYSSSEEAYQNLLAEGSGRYFDPINRPGNWNNNASFSDIHTQSPRTTSFDNGVTGGLDDRFDFILTTADAISGSAGMRYLPGTYTVVGNDGNHFNKSILDAPQNTSAPDSVIQALHAMSDHLAVIMDVEIDPAAVVTGIAGSVNYSCPELIQGKSVFDPNVFASVLITDLTGRIVANFSGHHAEKLLLQLSPGIYIIHSTGKNGTACINKVRVVE